MSDTTANKAGRAQSPKGEMEREDASPRQGPSHRSPPARTVLSAQDARQGEIILGRYGRWIWIGSFAAIVLFVLVLTFWS